MEDNCKSKENVLFKNTYLEHKQIDIITHSLNPSEIVRNDVSGCLGQLQRRFVHTERCILQGSIHSEKSLLLP